MSKKHRKKHIQQAKNLMFVVLLTVMLISIAGCSDVKTGGDSPQTGNTDNEAVNSLEVKNYVEGALSYIVNNNLTINSEERNSLPVNDNTGEILKNIDGFEYSETCQCSFSKLIISGLKDTAVQEKINDRISEVCNSLEVKGLPAFRGIRREIPEGSVIVTLSVYSLERGNFNNILSLSADRYIEFAVPDENGNITSLESYSEDSVSVSETITMTFDLNTGEELSLTDLFTMESGYTDIINASIQAEIDEPADISIPLEGEENSDYYYEFYAPNLLVPTGKFSGIREDQQFVITPWGLELIFDADTPEFDTGFGYSTHLLSLGSFGNMLAVGNKYMKEGTSIFTDDSTISKCLVSYYNDWDVIKSDDREIPVTTESNEAATVYVSSDVRYDSRLPQNIIDELLARSVVDEAELDNLIEQTAMGMFGDSGYYNTYVSALRYGNYIFLSADRYISGDDYTSIPFYINYDAVTGDVLLLKDIFVEGFNFESVIKEKMFDGDPDGIIDAYRTDQMKQLYYDNIRNFAIGTDGISIYFNVDEIPVLEEAYRPESIYMSYTDFGCDNLTLFS